ncbi:hypothetical protein GGF42_007068, partial [Coemansia sp. RSA 2424]
ILSHIYYQSSSSTPKPGQVIIPQIKSPLARTRTEETEDASDNSESKYQIEKKKKRRKVTTINNLLDLANPSKPTSSEDGECSESGDQSISVTVVRPFRSATVSDDEEESTAVDIRDVSFNAHDDMAVDSYLDSVTSTGLVTPAQHSDEGTLMEHHHIQIDALQLTSPAALTHAVHIRRDADAADDEYGYLDEAEIQGRNRYFMEEKEIICRKCYRPGHIAKDCTTITCAVCGNDGHTSKDCKLTGNVCHACNMRGHIASECPQRTESGASTSSQQRSRGCDRCSARTHHTEECATIWRRYVYAGSRPPEYSDVTAWCYNCAARGHFGDNCQMPRAKGSLAYQGDTAFGSVNCPGKMIHVSESSSHHHHHQRSSHFDSGRQYSSPSGHQNREDRRREHGYGSRRNHDSRGASGSRHHQNSSSGGSASRRPNRDNSSGKSNWNNNNSGGYHHTPSSGAVRNQHHRY